MAAVLDAWNRRDMETVARHLTPDFEWVEHDTSPLDTAAERRGTGAVRRVTSDIEEGFAAYEAELVDVVEVDSERVVVVLRESGAGRESGVPLSTEFGYVVTVRGELAAKVEVYRDPAEAFAAVGVTGRPLP